MTRGKRIFDVALGVPLALAFLPIVLVASIATVVTSGWPAVIAQERVGRDERHFRMLKLRTMRRDAPVLAKSQFPNDRSLFTPPGPFLRRWSIDELPQILNVLVGDMSLVGTRPALPSQTDLVAMRRSAHVTHLVPGLTGLAQVKGRESLTLSTKVRLEALYAKRRSLKLDLLILVWTARALLSQRGAY